MYINVDKATKTCTLHNDCYNVKKYEEGDLTKRLEDGGWYSINSIEEANEKVARLFAGFNYKKCGKCSW